MKDKREPIPAAIERLIVAVNNLEDDVEALNTILSKQSLTLADAHSQPSETVSETSKKKNYDDNLRGKAAQHLTSKGLSLDKRTIYRENGELVIDLKEDAEISDAWKEWSKAHFGEDKAGYISWGTFGREDGDVGYYPQAYRLPEERFDEVFG